MEEEIRYETILRELLETRQYTKLRQTASDMNVADIAAVMDDMEDEESLKMFRILPKDMAADVFANLELDDQQYIIQSLSDKEATNIIENLMSDDATDLLEEMPANVVKRILANASPETRAVADAIDRIRKIGLDSETVNVCYVVDKERILKGTVALRYLIIMQPDAVIGDFMNENVISINTMTDQEEAAHMFQKYDFTAMPVVDNEDRMVGIITIDDVVDIMQEEATEDIEKMAAILPTDKPYFKVGIFETYRKRMPWLLLLMISATFTGAIISRYEEALSACVILTAYIPMLMDTGGNAGSQSSVSVIRGISLGEIEFKDTFRAVWKEILVSVLCGVTLAATNFLKMMVMDRSTVMIALVVCITLLLVVFFSKLIGCVLPLVADRIGFDPAVMASPLITTIVDTISLVVYFFLATHLLNLAA